jgi:hypothetical protein
MNARQKQFPLLRSMLAVAMLVGGGAAIMSATAADAKLTLADVMNNQVMASSDVLWQAIVLDIGDDGKEIYSGPTTDADWQKLHDAMQALADTGTQLQKMPEGWQVRDPSLEYETPPGELAPDAIAALINKEPAAWGAHAEVLRAAAAQALQATETRDLETLGRVSDALDGICESCHLQFWYPDQPAA